MSMDWPEIIRNAVIAVISAATGWVAHSRLERNRRSYEVKQAHLQKLKEDVAEPLLNQIEFYYLPIFKKDENNVIGTSEPINAKDVPVDKPTFGREIKLSILSLEDVLERWEMEDFSRSISFPQASDPRPKMAANSQLYEDMRLKHDRRLMQKWETFVSKFDKYNRQCYSYVRHLANRLGEESGMLVWSSYESQRGINSARLASFVWERQICVHSEQLGARELGGRHELSCGPETVAIGTEEEIKNCRTIVERLIADEAESTRLQKLMANLNLEDEARSLREELNRFTLMSRLRGNCVYTKI